MSRNSFNSLKQLREKARQIARDVLEEVIEEDVKPVLLEAIQKAYDEYTSRADVPYDRRYANGGLLDPNTIEIYKSPDGLTIRLRQETMSKTGGELPVDVYVTQGDLYNWSNSEIYGKQPFPRDFYEYAKQELDKKLPEIFKKKFEERGIRTDNFNIRFRI